MANQQGYQQAGAYGQGAYQGYPGYQQGGYQGYQQQPSYGYQQPAYGGGGRGGPPARQGDWPCSKCGANNFAFRTNCFKCNAEGGDPDRARQLQAERAAADQNQPVREGDWNCPNCRKLNFAHRVKCLQCEQPKDDNGAPPVSGTNAGAVGPPMHPHTGAYHAAEQHAPPAAEQQAPPAAEQQAAPAAEQQAAPAAEQAAPAAEAAEEVVEEVTEEAVAVDAPAPKSPAGSSDDED